MRGAKHWRCLFLGVLLTYQQFASAADVQVWKFDQDTLGKTPTGFNEQVGRWRVVEDGGNRVVMQQAQNDDETFNVILVGETNAQNLDLSVRFKAIAGKLDQGGGLVWRAKDKSNYYIARYNPLEDNFRVYKVQDGVRTMFQNADIPHAPGWHTLRVTMQGPHIECYYDGKKYLEADDRTFKNGGKIGLWSKADAQTQFDDLRLSPLKPPE